MPAAVWFVSFRKLPMPRYFFDIKNGHRLADPAGLECPDDQGALRVARTIAQQIAIEVPASKISRRVAIRDEAGVDIGSVDVTW